MPKKNISESNSVDTLTNDSLQSTKRSIAILVKTEESGTNTLQKLDAQGRQLERTDRLMDEILTNEAIAKRQLNGMESITGYIANKFTSNPVHPNAFTTESRKKAAEKSNNHSYSSNSNVLFARNSDAQRNANVGPSKATADALDEISTHLNNLKMMANEMGIEINKQTKTVEVLNNKADKISDNFHVLIPRVRNLS